MNEEATRALISPWLVALVFGGVLAIWITTPFALTMLFPGRDFATRGQLGDLYGSVNALFSGLAFAGVLVTILLQRLEVRLQFEALAANQIELARTAKAQEESWAALQKTIHAQSFKTAIDLVNSDE